MKQYRHWNFFFKYADYLLYVMNKYLNNVNNNSTKLRAIFYLELVFNHGSSNVAYVLALSDWPEEVVMVLS